MKYKIPTEENMEEMKPDTEVKEETSVPEEGAAEATAEKPKKKRAPCCNWCFSLL